MGRDFVVDYQGDSAPEAVTEEAPAEGSGEVRRRRMLLGFGWVGLVGWRVGLD